MLIRIKHIIKSSFVWGFSRPLICNLFTGSTKDQITIFMLHRIADPQRNIKGHSPDFIRKTFKQLKQDNYQIVSLQDVLKRLNGIGPPLRRAVVFTMDDGYLDQAEIGAKLFLEFSHPLTIFLITGFIDGEFWPWTDHIAYIINNTKKKNLVVNINTKNFNYHLGNDKERYTIRHNILNLFQNLSEKDRKIALYSLSKDAEVDIPFKVPQKYQSLQWSQARSLEQAGISFAPHTVNHEILSHLTSKQSRYEIFNSWHRIKEELKEPLPILAYPIGTRKTFTEREEKYVDECGMKAALSAIQGCVEINDNLEINKQNMFSIKRFPFPDNMVDVLQYCSGIEKTKEKTKEKLKKFLPSEYIKQKYGGKRGLFNYNYNLYKYYLGDFQQYQNINWECVERILFVCKGNICRSPYAEIKIRQLGIQAESFGLDARAGSRANPDAIRIAKQLNVDLNVHKSKRLSSFQVNNTDLIIAMEPWQCDELKTKELPLGAQITLLGIWAKKPKPYIHDPYGNSDEYFIQCFNVIDDALEGIANNVKAKETCSPPEK